MPQPNPPLITRPFADDADPSYITYPIPNTTGSPGDASFEFGFPPDTMQEEVSGGVPPLGQDFNGILKMLSQHTIALEAGQLYTYSSGLSAAMSGYALGAVLAMSDGSGIWYNGVSGNTTDPDAGGAGWIAMYRYNYASVSVTGGTVTVTPAQYRSPVLQLVGTLTSNATLVLPTTLQRWIIANSTTGAFTVTAQTSGGSNTVVIPQGGYAQPVEIYGDGTNINRVMTPASLPTAVAPDPDTYVLRDNLGNVYGVRFNSNAGLENPTVGAVIVQNDAADGFLRKISLANFRTQLYQVGPGQSAAGNGYTRLPGGAILQWGTFVAAGNASTNVFYPVPYTSFSRPVCSGATPGDVSAQDNGPNVTGSTTTGFTVVNGVGNSITTWWIAIGF